MSEFTKGKWWIAPPIFDGDAIFAPHEVVAMGILNKADARLIAAAPELYELVMDEFRGEAGGILSFDRKAKIKAVLNRIDSKEDINA